MEKGTAYEVVIVARDPDVEPGPYRDLLVELHQEIIDRRCTPQLRVRCHHDHERSEVVAEVYPTSRGPLFMCALVEPFSGHRHPPDRMFMVHPAILRENMDDPRRAVAPTTPDAFAHWSTKGWREAPDSWVPEDPFEGNEGTLFRDLLAPERVDAGRVLEVQCSKHGRVVVDRAKLQAHVLDEGARDEVALSAVRRE
jgi:hypothetical protein